MIVRVSIQADHYSEPIIVEEKLDGELLRSWRAKPRDHDFPGNFRGYSEAKKQEIERHRSVNFVASGFAKYLSAKLLELLQSQDPINGYSRSELGVDTNVRTLYRNESQNLPPRGLGGKDED